MRAWISSLSLDNDNAGTKAVAWTMVWALVLGALFLILGLWSAHTVWQGLMWAAAWSSVGWFLGFLFGIPRVLSTDTARTPASQALEQAKQATAAAAASAAAKRKAATELQQSQPDSEEARKADAEAAQAESDAQSAKASEDQVAGSPASTSGSSLSVNTNLEQISDWLTKIIVGVSLVESKALLEHMHDTAAFMARSMAAPADLASQAYAAALAAAASTAASAAAVATSAAAAAAAAQPPKEIVAMAIGGAQLASAESLAYAVMLYFLTTGLLGSYLLTRLYLQRELNKVASAPLSPAPATPAP